MLVGSPVSEGVLDCPHLCGAGLQHRLIVDGNLLYFQTSFCGPVYDGSPLDGKKDNQGIEMP